MSRLYLNAALIVQAVEEKKQSLKKHCHGKEAAKIGKTEYLLACETLKYSEVLEGLFREAGVQAQELDVGASLLKVMAYEMLFGKGKIQGGGCVKRKLLEQMDVLKSTLAQQMLRKQVTSHDKLLSLNIQLASSLSKYLRINQIAMSIEEAFELVKVAYPAAELDPHIPSLVRLPPNTSGLADFIKKNRIPLAGSEGDEELVSTFIIQDKASCMPAQVLFDEYNNISKKKNKSSRMTDFLDACAAPGNKTSHLASLVYTHANQDYDKNTVYAFDKSVARSQLLSDRMVAAGALNVSVQNYDFLEVDADADEYSNVRFLLLDPSCSGSGVVRALERVLETENGLAAREDKDDALRLKRLQDFQIQVISKAMSFPAAEYIVYSTCSIHNEENEHVVENILRGFPDWDVQLPSCLSTWPRRGLPTEGLSEAQQSALIRCQPEDGMNGFFVALFKKKSNVGTGSHSCIEYKFSPPPVRKDQKSNKRKNQDAWDNDEQWSDSTNKKNSNASGKKSNKAVVATEVYEKPAKKVRDGRMLTVWKPKKRR